MDHCNDEISSPYLQSQQTEKEEAFLYVSIDRSLYLFVTEEDSLPPKGPEPLTQYGYQRAG